MIVIFCNREETVEHCFLQCHYVKEIWKELKKEYAICLKLKSFTHIRQWVLEWIQNATDFQSMIMAVAIWHIWENRNAYHNGEALNHPLRVVGKIKAYVEFINMHHFSSTTSIRHETLKSNQKWSPPPDGSMLVNVDAATFSQSARAGFGVVIRDHRGRVQATNRGYFERIQIPEVAEAMALRQALILANNLGIQNIMVASDCLSVINKVKGLGFDRSPIGAIVHDIRKCATKFVSCTFIHVNRSCNEAAHVLAKSAEHDVWSCWINEFPDVIRTIICNELIMNE
ncbi:hypothetical protein VPH35_121403 [Triticum aestivum]